LYLLDKIKEKLGDSEFSSQKFQEKYDEMNDILESDEFKKASRDTDGYESLGKTDVERIKKVLEEDSGMTIDEFITAYENYAAKVKLDEDKANSLKNLKDAKTSPEK